MGADEQASKRGFFETASAKRLQELEDPLRLEDPSEPEDEQVVGRDARLGPRLRANPARRSRTGGTGMPCGSHVTCRSGKRLDGPVRAGSRPLAELLALIEDEVEPPETVSHGAPVRAKSGGCEGLPRAPNRWTGSSRRRRVSRSGRPHRRDRTQDDVEWGFPVKPPDVPRGHQERRSSEPGRASEHRDLR